MLSAPRPVYTWWDHRGGVCPQRSDSVVASGTRDLWAASSMILRRAVRRDDAGVIHENTSGTRCLKDLPPNRLKPTVGPVTGLASAARPAPCPPAA
jgi:hypothetical protein